MRKISSIKLWMYAVFSLLVAVVVSAGVSYSDVDEENASLGDGLSEVAETFGNFSFDFVANSAQGENFSADVSKNDEYSEDSTINGSDSSSEDGFDSSSEDVSDSSSEDVSDGSSEDVSDGSSEDVSDSSSEDVSDSSSEDVSDGSSEDVSDSSSEDVSDSSSEDVSDSSSEDVSDSSSEDVSGDSSEDVSGDVGDNVVYPDDVTVLKNGDKGFVYFKQDDPKYDKLPYGKNTIGSHGCGPVNMAMIISTYTGNVIYPADAAKWSVDNGCYVQNVGSSHSLMKKMAQAFGVPVDTIPIGSWDKAMQALKDGKYLITRVGDGEFSGGPHFLTIRGITEDGKLLLANSIDKEDSEKEWSQSVLKENITLSYFWVYG